MNELQQIFADLKAEWRRRREQAAGSYQRHLKTLTEEAPMLRAVVAQRRGDTSAIPELLRSDRELSADDRQTLAQYLEGGFEPPPTAGRRKSNERWVAMQADVFLREWKDVAKGEGVSTYGSVPDMRDQAIEFIIAEFLPPELPISCDAVLEYMTKRGKDRQN